MDVVDRRLEFLPILQDYDPYQGHCPTPNLTLINKFWQQGKGTADHKMPLGNWLRTSLSRPFLPVCKRLMCDPLTPPAKTGIIMLIGLIWPMKTIRRGNFSPLAICNFSPFAILQSVPICNSCPFLPICRPLMCDPSTPLAMTGILMSVGLIWPMKIIRTGNFQWFSKVKKSMVTFANVVIRDSWHPYKNYGSLPIFPSTNLLTIFYMSGRYYRTHLKQSRRCSPP